ncbi:MAG: response regulator [Planctomycetota bacterium]
MSASHVYVVDDDPSVRKAVARLLRADGFEVTAFESASGLLEHGVPVDVACLVLDVSMPGTDGLDLQNELRGRSVGTPIVFLTGHGDIPMSVRAMRGGAVDFLVKPVDADSLLGSVRSAIDGDAERRERDGEARALRERLAALTARERDVLGLVVAGRLNKQIAAELGIALDTVKVHRGRVMRKARVESLAELVRLCERAAWPASASGRRDGSA